mmetsp:Transcript_28200/g.68644  ORF Transcript_28200/g.68644 Transcript_28200/m.68644 type:complete len:161 (+) Transcript_28200:1-483(+)
MPTFSSQKATVYIAGAGVVSLNGLYMQYGDDRQRFVKDGIYGGLRSEFEIKYHSADNEWRISVLPKTKKSIPLLMYQAFAKSVGAKAHEIEMPFNRWLCLEGPEPAPYVAIIQPPYYAQPPPFTSGTFSFSTPVAVSSTAPEPHQCPRFPTIPVGTRRAR